jgi:DNA-binding MarR family transcriptional regulator
MSASDTEGPWLTDEQQSVWRVFLAVQSLLPVALDAQLSREAGLSHSSYIVLALLSEAPERSLRMSQLALAVTMSPSRVSHAVARLEERGLVRRQRASDDGRGNRAILTDQGMEVLVAAAPGHAAEVKNFVFGGLSSEQLTHLGELLNIIENRLRTRQAYRVAPGRSGGNRRVT